MRIADIVSSGVRDQPDINAIATRGEHDVEVLIWNYHDDDLPGLAADVSLDVAGLPAGRPALTEYRIDGDHSNAYAAWKAMSDDPTYLAQLEPIFDGLRKAGVPER